MTTLFTDINMLQRSWKWY